MIGMPNKIIYLRRYLEVPYEIPMYYCPMLHEVIISIHYLSTKHGIFYVLLKSPSSSIMPDRFELWCFENFTSGSIIKKRC